jgi:hypothetical protein
VATDSTGGHDRTGRGGKFPGGDAAAGGRGVGVARTGCPSVSGRSTGRPAGGLTSTGPAGPSAANGLRVPGVESSDAEPAHTSASDGTRVSVTSTVTTSRHRRPVPADRAAWRAGGRTSGGPDTRRNS